MAQHLSEVGLPHEFFSGIDGLVLSEGEYLAHGGQSGLTRGEVGCWLSHLAVWRQVANEGLPCALVLEDDAQLDGDALPAIHQVASHPECFDVVRLSAIEKQVGIDVLNLDVGRRLVLPTKNPSGLAGYMVSARGVRRLTELGRRVEVPVDTAVDASWRWGGDAVMMVPAPIQHASGIESIITDTGRAGRGRQRGFFLRLFISLRKKAHLRSLARKWEMCREVFCEN
jgi:glycosyl transferase family 25